MRAVERESGDCRERDTALMEVDSALTVTVLRRGGLRLQQIPENSRIYFRDLGPSIATTHICAKRVPLSLSLLSTSLIYILYTHTHMSTCISACS